MSDACPLKIILLISSVILEGDTNSKRPAFLRICSCTKNGILEQVIDAYFIARKIRTGSSEKITGREIIGLIFFERISLTPPT